jgi:hypothetical protein
MTRTAIAVTLLLLAADLPAAEVARAEPYTFHSSFWINLHETLMHHAVAKAAPDLSALPANEAEAWQGAVDVYRKNKSGWNITFDRPMAITHDALTQFGDEAATPALREPLGPALLQAAPIYRRHFWTADDRANRFWIGYAAAMIRDAGEELARAHAKAYGAPWPEIGARRCRRPRRTVRRLHDDGAVGRRARDRLLTRCGEPRSIGPGGRLPRSTGSATSTAPRPSTRPSARSWKRR